MPFPGAKHRPPIGHGLLVREFEALLFGDLPGSHPRIEPIGERVRVERLPEREEPGMHRPLEERVEVGKGAGQASPRFWRRACAAIASSSASAVSVRT